MTNAGTPTPAPKSGMPSWLIILLVVLLVVVLGCCGIVGSCFFLAKRAAHTAMESAGVHVSKEGVTVENDKGSFKFGSNVALPANFPKDIPIYSGLTPMMATSAKEGAGNAILQGTGDRADIKDYYEREMEKGGWTKTLTQDTGDASHMVFTKDDRTATIMVTSDAKAGHIVLNISYGKQ